MGEQPQQDAGTAPPPRRMAWEPPTWLAVLGYGLSGLLVVSLLQGFGILRVYNVPSGSMQRTLNVGDRILISQLPYLGGGPARGDIVVFSHGDTWEDEAKPPASNPAVAAARALGDLTGIGTSSRTFTVKRVIGVEGDTVACCDAEGHVTVNGESLQEGYLHNDFPFTAGTHDCTSSPRSARCFLPISVPAGRLLVMGDHRSNSADSVVACRAPAATDACARLVAADRIRGQVFGKAWPPGPVG